jgi:outer membrane protein assembly factor BamB
VRLVRVPQPWLLWLAIAAVDGALCLSGRGGARAGLWAAQALVALAAAFWSWRRGRTTGRVAPGEGIALALLGLACASWPLWPGPAPGPAPAPSSSVAVVWTFEPAQRGAIIATPVVTAEHVYAAVIRDSLPSPTGAVYCLDRRRGTVAWQFDDGGAMLHMYCTPCLADGRLYVGEGMHGNDGKMYCLDAASGRRLWHVVTAGHIESSPCVAGGRLFFGSGDDGLWCLDAATGARLWHSRGWWHVDASPAVQGGRVYAGGGVSSLYRTTEVFCLDADDGRPLWRTATDLPAWGSPVADRGQVFFGLGNGRLTQSAQAPEKPAGALLCADAAGPAHAPRGGVGDAVFNRPAVDQTCVWFGARDGRCYCLDRRDGQVRWQTDMGSPIVTRPALIDGRLYVVASGGRVGCLDPADGRALWTFDVAQHSQSRPRLLSSPVVVPDADEAGCHHRIYFGAELMSLAGSSAVLYCLRD